jgi:copper chaperone CopZ
MGFKSFITKQVLKMKGVSSEQAESIAKQLDENPELAKTLKSLEGNKEVKALFEKITKEIDEKKKGGMPEQYAAVLVMKKYQAEVMKYREELMPLMTLMQK